VSEAIRNGEEDINSYVVFLWADVTATHPLKYLLKKDAQLTERPDKPLFQPLLTSGEVINRLLDVLAIAQGQSRCPSLLQHAKWQSDILRTLELLLVGQYETSGEFCMFMQTCRAMGSRGQEVRRARWQWWFEEGPAS
jgi:hypothetical protein